MEELLLKAFPEDKTLLPEISRTWDELGIRPAGPGTGQGLSGKPGKQGGHAGARRWRRHRFRDRCSRWSCAATRRRPAPGLRDMDGILGGTWTWEDFDALLAIARAMEDPAAVERLARLAINRIPRNQRLATAITLFGKVFPSLGQDQRARLVAHLVNSLDAGAGGSTGGIHYYAYPRLKAADRRRLTLPIREVRGEVERVLAQGGHFIRYIGPMFGFLSPEDFKTLLRETLSKAKSSDRLGILFSLIRQYPGKMDASAEALFSRLIEEAAEQAMEDPLKIYRVSTGSSYLTGSPKHPNAGFEAEILGMLAKRQQGQARRDFLLEQVRVWDRSGDTRRAAEAAGRFAACRTRRPSTKS